MTLLSSTTLASDTTFDVSAIDQTYNDLILAIIARGTNASLTEVLLLRLNNDSSANYGLQNIRGLASTPSAGELVSATSMQIQNIASATAAASCFSMLSVIIPGYTSTTWQKEALITVMEHSAITTGAMDIHVSGGIWNQASAVNRIQLLGNSTAALKTGSILRIYGRL